MAEFIPNQPINFLAEYAKVCSPQPFVQLVDDADVTQFQFKVEPCDDATTLLPNFSDGDWYLGGGSSFTADEGCMDGTASGCEIFIDGIFTPGNYYLFEITITDLVDSIEVYFGDLVYTITGNGTHSIGGYATTDRFRLYVPVGGYACISALALYDIDTAYEFGIYDIVNNEVATILFGDTTGDGKEYTFIDNGYVTAHIYWQDLGIDATPGCYRIGVKEPCNLVVTYSNWIKIGSYTGSDVLLINACNDSDAFGFKFSGNFSPMIRLLAGLIRPQYPAERTTEDNSEARSRVTFYQRRKKKTLAVECVPEYVHDFLSLLPGFDHIYIDNEEYIIVPDAEYLVQYPGGDDGNGSATIDVQIKEDLMRNVVCGAEESGCQLVPDGYNGLVMMYENGRHMLYEDGETMIYE